MAEARLTIEILKEETGITEKQLSSKIQEKHLQKIAKHFSTWEKFVGASGFNLDETDKADIKELVHQKGLKEGIVRAFICWLNKNPYATYRKLIDMLLNLDEGCLANQVCNSGKYNHTNKTKTCWHSRIYYLA